MHSCSTDEVRPWVPERPWPGRISPWEQPKPQNTMQEERLCQLSRGSRAPGPTPAGQGLNWAQLFIRWWPGESHLLSEPQFPHLGQGKRTGGHGAEADLAGPRKPRVRSSLCLKGAGASEEL